jgi:hypothetical protein
MFQKVIQITHILERLEREKHHRTGGSWALVPCNVIRSQAQCKTYFQTAPKFLCTDGR